MKMCELGSISESKNVLSLRRLNILCNFRLVLFFRCQVLRAYPLSNNAGEAVFVKYVVCICGKYMEVVDPNL